MYSIYFELENISQSIVFLSDHSQYPNQVKDI